MTEMLTTSPEARAAREARIRASVEEIYEELTDGLTRSPRMAELVYAAAKRHPDLLPSRAAIEAERELLQKDKQGLEIEQGIFLAHVLAHPRCGPHLVHAMAQPKAEELERLDELRSTGSVDLDLVRVDRDGEIGLITTQNHKYLNSEDDPSVAALETAVDLVLLDDAISVGVLRGAPAVHPKYAGRRIFGSGLNLTHLYYGKISLVEFMLERELGALSKMYRGHDLAEPGVGSGGSGSGASGSGGSGSGGSGRLGSGGPGGLSSGGAGSGALSELLEDRREKPFIAAVESFAIGGSCQILLVMDRVLAETGSYFNLPARKEGIIPGCANLRLPRFVGERATRQAIFFNRDFAADSPDGARLADEVMPAEELDAAIQRSAAELMSAGATSLVANRRQLRVAWEPLDAFRRYMASYAREQALCFYSPALIDNLERNWEAKRRSL
jgi:(3,5-dihydroxyphenyl)acetyl-CoA 1,2-dioxygenase